MFSQNPGNQHSPTKPRSQIPSQYPPQSKPGLMGGSPTPHPQSPPTHPPPQPPLDLPLGLANLGNTCYINSILQMLFQILNFPYTQNTGPVTRQYIRLRHTHSYQDNIYMKYELEKYLDFVKGGHQQDAQEFLRGLLELLNKENCRNGGNIQKGFKYEVEKSLSVYNNWLGYFKEMRNYDNSEVIDYFGGETVTEMKCQQGHTRYTFDRFMDMSLSFPSVDRIYNVCDLLRWNLRPEQLDNL